MKIEEKWKKEQETKKAGKTESENDAINAYVCAFL